MPISILESYRVVVPDRFLTLRSIKNAVSVFHVNSQLVATRCASHLLEGGLPAVVYVPMTDIRGVTLNPTKTQFRCRWKGPACFYDVCLADSTQICDGAWSFPDAPEEIALLRNHVSFDTEQFTFHINQHEAL